MKTRLAAALILLVILTVLVCAIGALFVAPSHAYEGLTIQDVQAHNMRRFMPVPPADAMKLSEWHSGPLDVAKVFGRSQGCENADSELIDETAAAAIRAGVPSRLLAALVAVESACNPMAVSSRSSLGLTQVNVKVWHGRYDFAGKDNPMNTKANLRVGSEILSGLVDQYGKRQGLQRYLGTGTDDGAITPGSYASKILTLAGEK